MSKTTKIILAIVGILVLVGGLTAGIILVRQNQELREKAAPATTLKISPASQKKLPGQTVTFTVLMNTGENQVTGVDLNLRYETDVIEIEKITKGSGISAFDKITENNFDSTNGTISYSAFTTAATAAVTGTSLEALRITARVKDTAQAGNYEITFSATTTVSAVESEVSVLISKTLGTLSILALVGEGTSTPTPTATASATPTATASATPTATPDALLDAGVSYPTILGISVGTMVILGSLLLIF